MNAVLELLAALLVECLIALGWLREAVEIYASQFVTPRGAG